MDSSSDNDSLTGADDTGGLSELDDTDKASVIGQHKRVSKVDDAVKTEAYEERMITSDTVGRSSCQKDEKENDDPSSQPMLERAVKGFTAERLLGIIVGEDTPDEKVCKRVPRGVRHHAAFVVDTTSLEADIVSYGDDNGSWTGHSKPRRKYCIEVEDDTGMLTAEEYQGELGDIQHLDNNIYTLCRNYFRHAHTPEFRKMIATVRDCEGKVMPLAVVQYYFEGGIEVPVKLAKHGNAKDKNASPYMRTSRPVLHKLKKKCSTETCRKAVEECFEEGGGSSGIEAVADVPRNRKQAYNLKQQITKKTHQSQDQGKQSQRHEFYDVLELLNKGTFVRDFAFQRSTSKSRTRPRSFQATDFQLTQLSRMCASQKYGSVLGVDATFNCGNFFVTLTSFQHQMFVNKQSGKHPVIIGPSIIHMTKEFEDYHYLASNLKTHCKSFEALTAFGTDGEINLANAFVCELPDAVHLRCKIHLSENIEGKLCKLSFKSDARQNILNTVFGRRKGDSKTKALVDATSAEEFDEMLDALETEWRVLEATQHSGEPQFHSWFKRHIAMVMKDNVIAPVREKAGLGSPPEFYTQNTPECCNSMVKNNAGRKKEWADFCISLESAVQSQEQELVKAVHEMGELRLSSDFKHLEIEADKWMGMNSAQRDAHIKRCLNSPLDKIAKSVDKGSESVGSANHTTLSVPYQDCRITTLSGSNLQQMWCSASKILEEKEGVLSVPWDKSGTQRLVYDGECAPPCQVSVNPGGGLKCSCQKFKSAMICAHSLAVAEQELCLPEFLAKVGKKRNEPDPYHLVSNDLPRSAGKKGVTKRKGRANNDRGPLMEIQSSCPATTSNRLPVDDSSSMAASALLQLSGSGSSTTNDDYFSLKALEGTQVRMCYGCGQAIRVPPHVPPPPHDFCVVNREYRSFKKPDGGLKVSLERQNCHYHLKPSCVKRKHQDFLPSALRIPPEIKPKLTAVHWKLLENEFEFMV